MKNNGYREDLMKSTQRWLRTGRAPGASARAQRCTELLATLNWIARPGANQGSAEWCRRGCWRGWRARDGLPEPRGLAAPPARAVRPGPHSSSERARCQPPPSGMSILLLVFARNVRLPCAVVSVSRAVAVSEPCWRWALGAGCGADWRYVACTTHRHASLCTLHT